MKPNESIVLAWFKLLAWCLVALLPTQSLLAMDGNQSDAKASFVHPGLLHSHSESEFNKRKLNAVTKIEANHYDVYLLAGQSNMDGRGHVSELTPAQRQPLDDAIIFYRNQLTSTEGWKPLGPGFSMPPKYKGDLPSSMFGPELGFAGEMLRSQPKRKLAIIKGSKGATSLRRDWNPGEQGEPETQGRCYRDFVETIQLATSALKEQGDHYTIRGLLWHQGESDSKSTAEVYQQRFMQFVKRIREDIGEPDLPVVVGEVFDNGKRDSVRAALRSVGNSGPEFGFVPSDGTATSDEGSHFDTASQLLLGKRYAETILKVQTSKPHKEN